MQMPDNARLKRLLDKKRRALLLPKSELAELENEYAELLNRIEAERKRLGVDEESINRFISSVAEDFCSENDNVKWLIQQSAYKKQIKNAEALVRKSADSGDIEDCKRYMQNLIVTWTHISEESRKNHQIGLLE